ncbi:hypothetical protein DPMN_027681 [Dreissena polymorpha]|uniref:Paraneoplastic antigen Ma-like C-terminal domain-containing protein n=1 Tax=Dreissena polymorpha TaxID=45954 RepID=A0A9D4REL0_DREPO|nr:hypothetical protein DPMN_027681 [Dreissena polymorpha]
MKKVEEKPEDETEVSESDEGSAPAAVARKMVSHRRKNKHHTTEESEEETEVSESDEGSAPAAVARKRVSHRRRNKKHHTPEESEDEIIKPKNKSGGKKSVNMVKRRSKKWSVPVNTTDTSGTETSDSSDEDVSLRRIPRGFDRHLCFSGSMDGKGDDFDSFNLKFTSYARAFKWTEDECRYCLCWSLQGDAAKYHTLISSGSGPLTYKQLMKKLEKRFGGKELVETAQARFNQACQEPNESLEVWADRVQMLSLRALRKISEKYAASQAVNRFCLGLENIEASKDVCLKRFKTMDEAKDYVHYYLHISSTNVQQKSSRRTSQRDDPEEVVNVFETSINRMQKIDERLKQMQSLFDKQMAYNSSEGAGGRANSGYGRGTRGFNQMDNTPNSGGYGRSGGF